MSVERRRRFTGCESFVLADPDSMEMLESFERADDAIVALGSHRRRDELEIHGVVDDVAVLTIVWGARP